MWFAGAKLVLFLKESLLRVLFTSVLSLPEQICSCQGMNCTSKTVFFFPLFFSQLEMLKQPGMIIVAVLGSTLRLVLIRDIESSVPI